MKTFFLLIPFFALAVLKNPQPQDSALKKTGTVKIIFVNTVKGKPLQLDSVTYTNPFAETYSVSKFRYYISRLALAIDEKKINHPSAEENFHLIDESNAESLQFSFDAEEGNYNALHFVLGVDSLHNVSGAQAGALDPLNDMFWTWNSGYVMAKLEGHSPQAKTVNNKIEYHIGGFAAENSVLKYIKLNFAADKILKIQAGKTSTIIIQTDIDTWWQQPTDLKIAEHPNCSSPGALAKKIADNYCKMFSIKDVVN